MPRLRSELRTGQIGLRGASTELHAKATIEARQGSSPVQTFMKAKTAGLATVFWAGETLYAAKNGQVIPSHLRAWDKAALRAAVAIAAARFISVEITDSPAPSHARKALRHRSCPLASAEP
jgi:hypothetical protein